MEGGGAGLLGARRAPKAPKRLLLGCDELVVGGDARDHPRGGENGRGVGGVIYGGGGKCVLPLAGGECQ